MTKKEFNWILYDWANSAYAVAIMTAILPVYFKDIVSKGLDANVSTAYWGYANTAATLILAILAPILGAIADYKGAKKKFFAVFLSLGIISTALLSLTGQGDTIKCLTIYIFSSIGFFGANVFYDSFLVDVTSKERMDLVSTYGFATGYIGSSIPLLISILIIANPAWIGLHSAVSAMQLSFVITAFWWFVFSIPFLFKVKQAYYVETTKNLIADSFRRIFTTFKEIKKFKNVFIFLIAYFFYIDGVFTVIKMAAVFGKDIGISSKDLLIILMVTQIVAFPFAILFGKLAERFSAETMIITGIGVYVFITVYACFIHTVSQYWILAILTATSQGGIQALSRSYFGKIIPKENSAQFYGFYDIFGKFSSVMGPLLVALFSQLSGSSKYGIFSLVILFIIGGGILLRIKTKPFNEGV